MRCAMKKVLLLLAISSLVGCGSSSSQGSHKSNDKPQKNNLTTKPTKPDNPQTPSKPKEPSQSEKTKTFDTDGWIVSDYDGEGTFTPNILSLEKVRRDDLNVITINGQTIVLRPKGYNGKEAYYARNNGNISRAVSGGKYSDFIFGAVSGSQLDVKLGNDLNNADIAATFSHGIKTPSEKISAKSGVALYKGDAFAVKEGVNGVQQGVANITVNFTQKKLGGTLSNFGKKVGDIVFQGDIIGNVFVGNKSNKYDDFNISYGDFYGKNGNELGGVVTGSQKDGDYAASFGAKKQ